MIEKCLFSIVFKTNYFFVKFVERCLKSRFGCYWVGMSTFLQDDFSAALIAAKVYP